MLTDLIREARKRAGLTQVALARRAGVPQSTVGRIETGMRIPSTTMAERLIRAAGLELRVGLGDPDPDTDSLFERTLRRTPRERLSDATRAARVAPRARRPAQRAGEGLDPVHLLRALREEDVRFVLVGGVAAILHGDVGGSLDLHVVPERRPGNLERLTTALRGLDARIRATGEPEKSPFDCSSTFFRNLAPDSILHLTTRAGDLSLGFRPLGTQGYADLIRDAVEIELEAGVRIRVASLADVIRSEEAVAREKDRAVLPRLRRLLDRTRQREPEDLST